MKDRRKWFWNLSACAAGVGGVLCCVGPFALAALGFAGAAATVAALFAPLSLPLLTLAFGIVAWRLYVARSRRERAIAGGVLAFVLLVAASPYLLAALRPKGTAGAAADAKAERCLAVEGMTCAGCEKTIEAHLARVSGVVRAEAFADREEVCVEVDATAPPSDAALVAAVKRAGYEAKPKS